MTGRGGSVQLHAVTKRFDARADDPTPVHAARDLELTIGPDEAVGIIGPNGAGKSTLLRMIAGVSPPTAGRISRRGRTCSVIELGAGIHPDLTGNENLDLLALLHGLTGEALAARRERIVAFSGISDALEDPARTYSTGMLARLAFAVAAHTDPDLLLLDEVLSVGDIAFQQQCRHRIAELREEGVTVLMVSHDLELIGDVCDRAILLEDGEVRFDGPADAAIRRYVGLPDEPEGDPRLTARLARTSVPSGSPVELHLDRTGDLAPDRLRIDLVARTHPTFLAVGQDLSVVFGSAAMDPPPPGPATVLVGTERVPSGQYEVHCVLETSSGAVLASRALAVAITGPPGPFAIRLGGTSRIEALPGEAGP